MVSRMAEQHDLASEPQAEPGEPFLVAEFFAGIGLVRMGLEKAGFKVAWANDIDENKKQMYAGQFGDGGEYQLEDIAEVKAEHLGARLGGRKLDLVWASFPCIDVSLAGRREGIHGRHTGTFWNFIDVIKNLDEKPPVVALENVVGLATSDKGQDLVKTVDALNQLGYSADVLVIDARRFVPQSRPRLFLVGVRQELLGTLERDEPHGEMQLRPALLDRIFANDELITHQALLPQVQALTKTGLAECIDDQVTGNDDRWWDETRKARFVDSLTSVQRTRLDQLVAGKSVSYRTAYRRTRNKKPVWEIRADEIAGCLRTARGGSSKQAIVEAGRGKVRIRWMTGREYASLMGAAEYHLDGLRDNQIVFGFGDAVCVDVVEWLGKNYLMPLAQQARAGHPSA